jgi:hypothetical protein
MISTRTIGRLAAAAVLVATTTVVAFGSPAGAEDPTTTTVDPSTTTEAPTTTLAPDVYPTGSLVDNGDGTVTLTYANVDPNADGGEVKDVYVIFAPTGATCAADPISMVNDETLILSTASSFSNITASPMLIQAGTAVVSIPGFPTNPAVVPSTLPAGTYQTCLYGSSAEDPGFALLSSAPLAISAAPAPAPAPEPVVPAYTG